MMYYIIPQGKIDEYIQFTEEYAPKGYTGYNLDEISEIMLTPEWYVDGDIINYKK